MRCTRQGSYPTSVTSHGAEGKKPFALRPDQAKVRHKEHNSTRRLALRPEERCWGCATGQWRPERCGTALEASKGATKQSAQSRDGALKKVVIRK
jgi:hypothetical protein